MGERLRRKTRAMSSSAHSVLGADVVRQHLLQVFHARLVQTPRLAAHLEVGGRAFLGFHPLVVEERDHRDTADELTSSHYVAGSGSLESFSLCCTLFEPIEEVYEHGFFVVRVSCFRLLQWKLFRAPIIGEQFLTRIDHEQ